MKFIKGVLGLLTAMAVLTIAVCGIYSLYPLKYVGAIRSCADEMQVDKYLIAALIKAESNFSVDAVSGADAKGVMQLTDETADFCAKKLGTALGEGDIYRPEINIRLGVYYFRRVLDMFEGNEALAIAAYNAGEGRVKKWLSEPEYSPDGKSLETIPYEETRRHVEKITLYKKIYKLLYPNL